MENIKRNLLKTWELSGITSFALVILLTQTVNVDAGNKAVFQANGVKIGEVNQDSAIVWVRLTRAPEQNLDGPEFLEIKRTAKNKDNHSQSQVPDGLSLDQMRGSVPGAAGQARIIYWRLDKSEKKLETDWEKVDVNRDYTYQFRLTGLGAGAEYEFMSQCRSGETGGTGQTVEGKFKTAPAPDQVQKVVFTVVTGQEYTRRDDKKNGHKIYPVMQALAPEFFVHTGDIVYFDKLQPFVQNQAQARLKWNRMYSFSFQRNFHNNVSSYFIKDDHETWQNDCWREMKNNRMGELTFQQGQAIFLEQVPMSDKTYRTVRWGKDLQIWMVEGRDFRSANTMADGPDKTIWGGRQKEWFRRTVGESDATFRILISPTPLVGPDRGNKNDNHANKGFTHEGNELRQFISQQKNMTVICGDRHWQYVSVDPQTGVREYSCGPTSNTHAGGFKESMREPMHQYLKICGGFLAVTIERINGKSTLTYRHHSVDGKVLNEDAREAK